MASKSDRFYFENLIEAAECSCNSAEYLVQCLTNYNAENLNEMIAKMHEFEHAGDVKKHEMSAALAKAFVTPVDREDLALISHNIDNVSDSIEEVLQKFYMYNIKEIMPEAITFATKLFDCCRLMIEIIKEFANFKKSNTLSNLIIEMNNIEEECDKLYIESTRLINDRFDSALDIISWREIFNHFEECADSCEHVGDDIETVIMKNS